MSHVQFLLAKEVVQNSCGLCKFESFPYINSATKSSLQKSTHTISGHELGNLLMS